MRLTSAEVEYLAAWAREEQEPECYRRPAHRLQLSHEARGADLIDLIKAWTHAEGKPDRALLEAAGDADPSWPWASTDEFRIRLREAQDAGRTWSDRGGAVVREKR